MAWGKGQARTGAAAWIRLTREVLARDRYWCQLRYPDRCIGTATQADHILRPADGGTDDPSNLRGACAPCHAKRSSEQGNAARERQNRPAGPHPGLL